MALFSRAAAAARAPGRRLFATAARRPLGDGYDQAINHSREHMAEEVSKWRLISAIGFIPVTIYAIKTWGHHEEHHDVPAYPYLKFSTRVPRFPWGDRDLIGTPEDRKQWAEQK